MDYFVSGTPIDELAGKPINGKKLEEYVFQELKKFIEGFDISKRPLTPLKQETIEKKKKMNLPRPSQPLYGTGDLVNSIEVKYTGSSIQLLINDYLKFQKSEYYRNFIDHKAVNKVIQRGIKKYLRENKNV